MRKHVVHAPLANWGRSVSDEQKEVKELTKEGLTKQISRNRSSVVKDSRGLMDAEDRS